MFNSAITVRVALAEFVSKQGLAHRETLDLGLEYYSKKRLKQSVILLVEHRILASHLTHRPFLLDPDERRSIPAVLAMAWNYL